ncbi:MAG: stage II sporulation protein D [Clostridia bacterium]|jgi:stage II sporulation protein D|nr:stage II sporulation protein D [Clostridia bacterium]
MKKMIVILVIIEIFSMIFMPVAITAMLGKVEKTSLILENTDNDKNDNTTFTEDEGNDVNSDDSQPSSSESGSAVQSTSDSDKFEDYIVGVVAAEMPALFEQDALKAQAVAARTYADRKIKNSVTIAELEKNGGQAYVSKSGMKKKWGSNFNKYYEKVRSAVYDTKGEIMVYDGEPILAAFHAISCGKTESAANVWQKDEPYLKSVDSSMDKSSSQYEEEVKIPSKTVASKLEQAKKGLILNSGGLKAQMQVLERTDAGYIKTMQIGNLVFTGPEIRQILGLRSSDFTVKEDGDNLVFTTKGYGHGAGMSQYGANCLAQEGKNYKDILKYYYTGISFSKLNQQ